MAKNNLQPSVSVAKANFAAAVNGIRPLKSITNHPFATISVAAAIGVLISYAGLKFASGALMGPALPIAVLKKLKLL